MAAFARVRRLTLGLVVLLLVAGMVAGALPPVAAQGPVETVSESGEGSVGATSGSDGAGERTLVEPAPGSKSAAPEGPAIVDGSGAVSGWVDATGAATQADAPYETSATASPWLPGDILTCSSAGDGTWWTTSGALVVVLQCTLNAPESGRVLIQADGVVAYVGEDYEAQFELGADSVADNTTDRYVNVYADARLGNDENVRLSVLKTVTAGVHTFFLAARRYSGGSTVWLRDPTLSAIYVPDSSDVLTCGGSGGSTWTSTSNVPSVARQCQLDIPQDGWIFLSADAWLLRVDDDYRANFQLGVGAFGTTVSDKDRWVSIYGDSGDGTDKAVALSVLNPVTAGTYTFTLWGRRFSGTGTAYASDATISALYIPASSATAVTCGSSGSWSWTTDSAAMTAVQQCTLDVPRTSVAFISSDASMEQQTAGAVGAFELGIDGVSGVYSIQRYTTVYSDTPTGGEKSMALSLISPVAAGTHTFYLMGSRLAGTGTVYALDPTLTVLVPGVPWTSFLPLTIR